MRPLAALSLVVMLVLAGCSAPIFGGSNATPTATTGSQTTSTTGSQTTPTTGSQTTPTTGPAPDGTATTDGDTSATTAAGETQQQSLADPPQDVLGWEGGLWYNESLSITADNGLNASEQALVVNRTMARIETIRQLEFTKSVPVKVISRKEFQRRPGGISAGTYSTAFRRFDNVKFEAMFLVGEKNNSLAVQQSNRNQSILGFYSPKQNSIVVISPNGTPQLTHATLSHELVHALQDQHFDLSADIPKTREAANTHNSLIEGGANYVQHRYGAQCNTEWQCIQTSRTAGTNDSGRTDFNLGVYLLSYFPYADGPDFIEYIYNHRGWSGVNSLYENPPASTEQIINPKEYGRDVPSTVTIRDSSSNGWTRVRPDSRPDYAVLGQSALSTMFAYTLYDDYNTRLDSRDGASVVAPMEFFNVGAGGINRTDPFDYDLNYTSGWDGDLMYIYEKNGNLGYVWKITWDSPEDAREFVRGYERLLDHWGGERVRAPGNVWRIGPNSPFTDAFRITRRGDTVIIVNAPQVEDLSDVHARPSNA